MRNNRVIIKKILGLIRPYSHYLLLSLVFAVISVALTLYAPILTGKGIDFIVAKGLVNFKGLVPILYRLGFVVLLTSIAQWLMNLCNNKMTYRIVKDMRTKVFSHLEVLPLKYIDSHQYGDIISRVVNDIDQFSDGLLLGFSQLFTGIITILGTFLFMLSINVKITFIVVLITPLSFLVANYIAKHTFLMFQKQSATRGAMTSLVDELVGNQKIVQTFGYEEDAIERFGAINKELQKYSVKAIFFSSISNPATRFVNGLVYAGVGIFGAFLCIQGKISVGQLSCFLTYANQYTKPFNEISSVITELQNALASAERVFELLEERAEEPDAAGAIQLKEVDGSVKLEKVSFSYRSDVKLIENLNLSVKPGQRIAIVGPTGCGKTTIINLLMRFYDVDSGKIIVSNNEVRDITRDSLRSNYGMVLQETWLKSGTIRENIAFGKPEASDKEIVEAAKAAHAHSFIKRMPEGYETVISEEGGNLSQGQKQLLCIARVMLCLPPMLILDEATSSIDTRTEIRIQKAFWNMMEGRTSFIVAHRLSTIMEADLILVMKDGHIVEQGRHDELLRADGFYAELYNSQFEAIGAMV
ncbi:ABC transporter ATP-binding protein [Anaerocolumna sp. MB42-C2]|uniref:ABC transporter ATP-binding protein n=1 Tax=Anaerocolumna sp. MB42-C2 TaxID=3070997 RepID=UPI0027E1C353|nr:ABC transporter ATP-binding protein [Anaerocolumna sp. MB42-C2]WMJ89474.1 ABC transporter ATP-binding protein [Anaerocolumna sp. MB42-C2]